MKKILAVVAISLIVCSSNAQIPYFDPIDTVVTEQGTILIYPNRTWAYQDEQDFDGILNEDLHSIMCGDTLYGFETDWDHFRTILSTTNDVEAMADTVWICVVDSAHAGFCIPRKDVINSDYGYRHGRHHNGVDIDLEIGDTIYSAFDGRVRYSQYNESGFGNLIIIRHYNGLETYYGHCSRMMVAPNQEVKAGEPIALGGNTGKSTGPHLHFEVRFYDNPLNPEEIFDFKNGSVEDNLLVHRYIFRPGATAANKSGSIDGSSATHKIRSGDTLGRIAIQYGTSVSTLCRLNGISDTEILNIGRVLRVK